MATTNTWDQVVQKITGVVNRGAFSKTYTPSTSKQTQNGSAGYYSSITTACNAVSLSGNAATSQVLTGRTFYTTSLTRRTGTMANRGNLNWSGSNTTYSVPAGYYSGGTLDSRTSYNNGYSAGRNSVSIQQRTGTVTSYIPSPGNRYVSIPLSGSPIAMVVNYGTTVLYCMVNGAWWRCQNNCQSISSPVVSQSSSAMVINTSTNTTHDWNYRYIYRA